jgi:hypothetical protein
VDRVGFGERPPFAVCSRTGILAQPLCANNKKEQSMTKIRFVILILVLIAISISIIMVINSRTYHIENNPFHELNDREKEILTAVYPKLALLIPNLFEYYFEGLAYDRDKNIMISFLDFCHLRKIGCLGAGKLIVTMNSEFKILEIGGQPLPTIPIEDTLDKQINKFKRDMNYEMHIRQIK